MSGSIQCIYSAVQGMQLDLVHFHMPNYNSISPLVPSPFLPHFHPSLCPLLLSNEDWLLCIYFSFASDNAPFLSPLPFFVYIQSGLLIT